MLITSATPRGASCRSATPKPSPSTRARAIRTMVTAKLAALVAADILVETTARRRDSTYAYKRYLDLLRVDTDFEVR